jgi:AraC-like DNA-binding protein
VAAAHPDRHLLRAKDLIDARYADALDTGALAAEACCSEAHFIRSFKRAFGETPHQYLLTRRLERAAALLRGTDYSVAEVCVNVGLTSVGSFTTSFRRVYRMTPTAYRAAFPPAARLAPIPTCVIMAHARPSRNGEDRGDGRR